MTSKNVQLLHMLQTSHNENSANIEPNNNLNLKNTDSKLETIPIDKVNLHRIDTVTCHVCEENVPKMFLIEHRSSFKHKINIKIANTALERIKRHMNDLLTIDEPNNSQLHFCPDCVTVVEPKLKSMHENSSAHKNSLMINRFLSDFYIFYSSIDSNNTDITDENNNNHIKEESSYEEVDLNYGRMNNLDNNVREADMDVSNINENEHTEKAGDRNHPKNPETQIVDCNSYELNRTLGSQTIKKETVINYDQNINTTDTFTLSESNDMLIEYLDSYNTLDQEFKIETDIDVINVNNNVYTEKVVNQNQPHNPETQLVDCHTYEILKSTSDFQINSKEIVVNNDRRVKTTDTFISKDHMLIDAENGNALNKEAEMDTTNASLSKCIEKVINVNHTYNPEREIVNDSNTHESHNLELKTNKEVVSNENTPNASKVTNVTNNMLDGNSLDTSKNGKVSQVKKRASHKLCTTCKKYVNKKVFTRHWNLHNVAANKLHHHLKYTFPSTLICRICNIDVTFIKNVDEHLNDAVHLNKYRDILNKHVLKRLDGYIRCVVCSVKIPVEKELIHIFNSSHITNILTYKREEDRIEVQNRVDSITPFCKISQVNVPNKNIIAK